MSGNTGMRIARKGTGKGGRGMTNTNNPVEYPNTLRSRATARVAEVISEGPIQGPWHLRQSQVWPSVFLDDTAVQDPNSGVFNFRITQGDLRYGLPSQDPLPGWPLAEAEFAVGVECTPFVRVIRSLNTPVSAVRYKMRLGALFMTEDDGDVNGTDISYSFEYRIDGGPWQMPVYETIWGKTMSPYERAVLVQLPYTVGTVEVAMTRQQEMPSNSKENNTMFFASYTEIEDGQLSYDDTAVIALAVDAEEFSNLPKRSYLIDGVQVQVPNIYTGMTHGYSSLDWNGAFTTQWTNNPAWLLYAFLTNERWGLGRFLDVNAIDKWSFFQSAVYNDQGVPNGVGGYEYRFTCNAVLNTQQDAYTVLQAIASNMLAQIYYANGTIFLVQDRRLTSPERVFGPADVVDGLFDYQSADVRTAFTAAAVRWNDPDDKYETAIELVVDPVLVSKFGYRETPVNAFGCTSRGQAQRLGRWTIYTAQFETEVVTFRTSLENADLKPGQLINVNDPSRAGARLAGRLLDNDAPDLVTLDRLPVEITWNPAAWRLVVVVGSAAEPDNRPRLYEMGVVEVQPPFTLKVTTKPEAFPPGSMWLLHTGAVEAEPWRVNTISDQGDGLYQITATEYHVEKFDYVENNVLIEPPSFSLIPTGPLLGARDLRYKEYIYLDARGIPQFGIIFSWMPSPDARVTRYQIEMSGPNADYRIFRQVVGVAQDVPSMRQGEWYVSIVAFDGLGRKSVPTVLVFTPVGLTAKPLPPRALFITTQGRTTTLIWLPSGEIDVMYYWIKWSPETDTSPTWSQATTNIAQVDRNTTQITTPTRSGTYMVKCIDSLGQESDDWIAAVLVEQITDDVFEDEIAEDPAWLGDLGTHWEIDPAVPPPMLLMRPPTDPEPVPPDVFPGDRAVALNQTPTRMSVYTFDAELDLGIVSSVVATASIMGYGIFPGFTMSTWLPLASAVPLAMGASSQWDAHIEMRIAQADGTTFGPWVPLTSTVTTGRRFQWRMVGVLFDLATYERIIHAQVRVDIPLRNLSGDDAALDSTGHLTVTYAAPFRATPTVQLTARESLVPGGNIVLIESTPDHFRVEHRGPDGLAKPFGAIDYFVQGYGGGVPATFAFAR